MHINNFHGVDPARVEELADRYLRNISTYRWLRRYSPEDSAELCRQYFSGEKVSDIRRRADMWVQEIGIQSKAEAADYARFDADH